MHLAGKDSKIVVCRQDPPGDCTAFDIRGILHAAGWHFAADGGWDLRLLRNNRYTCTLHIHIYRNVYIYIYIHLCIYICMYDSFVAHSRCCVTCRLLR